MSREVDERIVAMRFDNQDFERHAKSTLKTLEKLKSGLQLDEATKGFDSLQKATKALDFEKITQSARKLKSTLGDVGSSIKDAFKIGNGPIHEMENLFSTFRSYVGRFVGFDLASKLVGSFESAIRQVTVEPIQAGWKEYELKMDSIKTIMSGSGESLEVVKDKLEELNRYADKTIYSFSDMTSNIGKFTNNGVKLDDATAAIKGIANATADAGQGAQQASMAMYNISQALGAGTMKLVDWKSLENANIATSKLKNTFLEVGAAMTDSKLKKFVDKDGKIHFFAIDDSTKAGKQRAKLLDQKKIAKMTDAELQAYLKKNNLSEVTANNFRESLSENWLDKDVLLRTLQIYSGDELDMDTLQSWGFTEEQALELMKIGQEASKAATEVRTFSKMWDALKEAAQSGWAQSIEYIFGDMEEGTHLWTQLNDIFGEILNASAENRNNVLLSWRGMERQEDGTIRAIRGANDGRSRLIQGVLQIIYLFQAFGKTFSNAFENVFGKMTGEKLYELTDKFTKLTFTVRNWFGISDQGNTRLAKIRKGLQGLLSVVKTVLNFVKMGASLVGRLVAPVGDILINLFEKFGNFFDGMGNMKPQEVFEKLGAGIQTVWTKLKGLFTLNSEGELPLVTKLKSLWENLKSAVRSWADENGLSGVLDTISSGWSSITSWTGWTVISNAFTTAKEGVETAWNSVKNWTGWATIGKFFSDIWGWFTDRTADKTPTQKRRDEILANLTGRDEIAQSGRTGFVLWLERVKTDLTNAWNDVAGWEGWETIGKFLSDVWSWIGEKANAAVTWFSGTWDSASTGFVGWLGELKTNIETAWGSLTGWSGWQEIGSFFTNIWDWFTKKTAKTPTQQKRDEILANLTGQNERIASGETGFTTWLQSVKASVESVWNDVAGWEGWKEISKFFSSIWNWISEKFGVAIDFFSKPTEDGDTGFVNWLQELNESIQKTWNDITGWEGWKSIGQFFSDIWGWITSLGKANEAEDAGEAMQTVNETVEEVADNAPAEEKIGLIERILSAIGGFWEQATAFASKLGADPTLNSVWNTINKVFEIVASIAGAAVDLVHSAVVEGNASSYAILGTIGAVFALISGFFNYSKVNKLKSLATISENSEGIGNQILKIAGAIALIAGAVAALAVMDEGAVWKAVGQIAAIGALLGALMGIAKATRSDGGGIGDAPVTGLERIANNLIKWGGIAGTVAIAMKALPAIIEAIGKAGAGVGTDVLNSLVGIVALIGGLGLVFSVIDKVTSGKGLNIAATAKTAVSLLAGFAVITAGLGALFGITGGIASLFGEDSAEKAAAKIREGGLIFAAIGDVIRMFIESLFVGSTGAQQEKAESQMNFLAEMSNKFDASQLSRIGGIVSLVERLSNMEFDAMNMDLIQEYLGKAGTGLANFSDGISKITGAENSEQKLQDMISAMSVLETFGNTMRALSESLFLTGYYGWGEIEQLWDEDRLTKTVDLYSEAAKRLAEAVQEGVGDGGDITFNATPIVDSIIAALGLGEDRIAKAVHDFVQAGLDYADKSDYKVSSDTNVDISGAGDIISQILNNDGKLPFDISGIEEQLTGEGGLLSKLTGFEDQIPSMSEMFANKGWNMVDEEGNQIDITAELTKQLGTLQDSLANLPAFEIKITPVFDMSQMSAETIQGLLAQKVFGVNMAAFGGSVNVDNTQVLGKLEGINNRLDTVVLRLTSEGIQNRVAIAALGSKVDGVASTFAQMKVILDSGAVVGALSGLIDLELGDRLNVFGRTGVTPL